MAQLVQITAIASNDVGLSAAKVVALPVQSITLETISAVYSLGTALTKVTYFPKGLQYPITYSTVTAIGTIVTAANA